MLTIVLSTRLAKSPATDALIVFAHVLCLCTQGEPNRVVPEPV